MDFFALKEHAAVLYRRFSEKLVYHNALHAEDVRRAVLRLASIDVLDEKSVLLVEAAAIYHDIGFLETYEDHETRSIEIVKAAFPGFGFDPDSVEIVCRLIEATRIPQRPQTRLERLLCDADLDNLGRNDFLDVTDRLFDEKVLFGLEDDRRTWYCRTLEMLENHVYFTRAARSLRDAGKQTNRMLLRNRLEEEFGISKDS